MSKYLCCPQCHTQVETWRNPAPTVDMIIYHPDRGVVLVRRANPPLGFALPGGFVDEGETVEHAALRETMEETHLTITLTGLLGVYSDPARDARRHTMSTVFVAKTAHPEALMGGDDAAEAHFYSLDALPPLVFDHERILEHFKDVLAGSRALAPISTPPTQPDEKHHVQPCIPQTQHQAQHQTQPAQHQAQPAQHQTQPAQHQAQPAQHQAQKGRS